eukprot:Tamp_01350.p1 GENE.Tamp_01350~~Tamp_01350.p1  ORF type:complete len:470 (+),score=32.93 Tamp_01350:2705-4114(+)
MKKILDSKGIINKVLSSTQRKTPTVVHKRFSIERIRRFYIKKIKFVQQNFSTQLSEILENFPSIDYIHPFFGDLLDLMFQRQHYKIALSKISVSKGKINVICKNFVKLVKNGNTSYVCKQSKKEAFGKICTIVKKLNKSFIFLEKIRKHLENLPNLDPYRKVIILQGSSKVGKSSFLNKTTRVNVRLGDSVKNNNFMVIGHMQSNFSQLQILDINGTINQAMQFDNRFVIQVYNTFLNLDYMALNFFDLSECLSSSLNEQIKSFKSFCDINPIIEKLPILNKTDLSWEKFLNSVQRAGINFLLKIMSLKQNILKTSFHDEIGIYSVRNKIYQTIFSVGKFENNKKTKIKFSRTLLKNSSKKLNSHFIDFKTQYLNKKLILVNNSKQRPETNFQKIRANPFLNDINSHSNNLIQQNDVYNTLPNLLNEREQKNREIKIEKIFIKKNLRVVPGKKKINKDFVFCSRNFNSF